MFQFRLAVVKLKIVCFWCEFLWQFSKIFISCCSGWILLKLAQWKSLILNKKSRNLLVWMSIVVSEMLLYYGLFLIFFAFVATIACTFFQQFLKVESSTWNVSKTCHSRKLNTSKMFLLKSPKSNPCIISTSLNPTKSNPWDPMILFSWTSLPNCPSPLNNFICSMKCVCIYKLSPYLISATPLENFSSNLSLKPKRYAPAATSHDPGKIHNSILKKTLEKALMMGFLESDSLMRLKSPLGNWLVTPIWNAFWNFIEQRLYIKEEGKWRIWIPAPCCSQNQKFLDTDSFSDKYSGVHIVFKEL